MASHCLTRAEFNPTLVHAGQHAVLSMLPLDKTNPWLSQASDYVGGGSW